MATRQMKLGLFIRPGGHHIACWRHPRAQADAGVNFPHFVEMAQIAERGLFDMCSRRTTTPLDGVGIRD